MLNIPHQAIDSKFIASIEGYRGNIHKLGRLIAHEWWTVIDKEGKPKERYLFLFKARILVCKVRRISEDRSVFVLKDIVRVSKCYGLTKTMDNTILFYFNSYRKLRSRTTPTPANSTCTHGL